MPSADDQLKYQIRTSLAAYEPVEPEEQSFRKHVVMIRVFLVQLLFLSAVYVPVSAQQRDNPPGAESPTPERTEWIYENESASFGYSLSAGNGRIFVGDGNGTVHALSAEDGTVEWTYDTGGEIRSEPVFANQRIFVGNQNKQLYCLDAKTGEQIWSFQPQSVQLSPGSLTLSLAVSKGRVVFGYRYTNTLFCLDAESGTLIWKSKFHEELSKDAALTSRDVFVTTTKKLYRLNARTGKKEWRYKFENWQDAPPTSATVGKTRVYISTRLGDIFALNKAGGQVVWKKSGETSPRKPSLDEGKLYIGTNRNIVCRNAADGSVIWEFRDKGRGLRGKMSVEVFPTSGNGGGISISNGYLYAISFYSWRVFSLNKKSGTLRWKDLIGKATMLDVTIQDAPIVYRNRLYVLRQLTIEGTGESERKKGFLYCLNTDLPESANDWPTQGGNPGRTGTVPDQDDED